MVMKSESEIGIEILKETKIKVNELVFELNEER